METVWVVTSTPLPAAPAVAAVPGPLSRVPWLRAAHLSDPLDLPPTSIHNRSGRARIPARVTQVLLDGLPAARRQQKRPTGPRPAGSQLAPPSASASRTKVGPVLGFSATELRDPNTASHLCQVCDTGRLTDAPMRSISGRLRWNWRVPPLDDLITYELMPDDSGVNLKIGPDTGHE